MNIGILMPNWIGDSVMATPLLRALRKHFGPHANLVGIMKPKIGDVLDGIPWFDERLFYERGRSPPELRLRQLLQELRRRQLDKLILLPNSLTSAAIAWFSGAVERIGYDRYGRGCLLTHRVAPLRKGGKLVPVSAVDYYLELARTMGCQDLSPRVELATTSADESAANHIWEKYDLQRTRFVVAFNTGSAVSPARHWPVDYYVQLAQRIVANWDATVLVLCGPSERVAAAEIARRAEHGRVKSLAEEKVPLGPFKACIRRCQLMVSTDSGPRHIAAAFEVPTVALFGPIHPAWTVNYNSRELPLRVDLPCSPCNAQVCPLGHHRCMRELDVDLVFAAVGRLIPLAGERTAA